MDFKFSKLEEKILKFWRKDKTFERSLKKTKGGKKFVFFQGPPYLNGLPHMGHFFTSVIKDVILRYKAMQGYFVSRKGGWDTHGLPTENEVEKRLKIDIKKEVNRFGMEKFIKECKKSIYFYKSIFEKSFERFGSWLDYKNAYITCSNDYIESIWFILKEIWRKKLLYQDFKVSPYCPRCGTILSSHEVAQGYKKIKEPAIYVKFPILNPEFKNTSLLVWTTTPWTLPGNVAIAINENFVYSKFKTQNSKFKAEYLILAKDRIKNLNLQGEIVEEFKGKDLVGLRYEGLYPYSQETIKNVYQVIPANFVSLEEGTGLVHIAPAFGEEDMMAIKNQNAKIKNQNEKFPILLTVDNEGKFKLEIKKWAGLFVKEADPLITEDLKKRNLLFKEELYEHDYPFCWRCSSPLLYYAKKSWFIRMTRVKKDLIKNNQKINWIPGHLKKGRFGEWLKEVKDWALSRERYWGTPLPIWCCQIGRNSKFDRSPFPMGCGEIRNPKFTPHQKFWWGARIQNSKFKIQNSGCGNIVVIGSKEDLLRQKFSTNQYFILRHGQTIYQTEKKDKIYPFPEKELIGLAKEGIQQIQKVAQKLKKEKIDLIYSSDFYRAKQTAEIVAKELNLKINFDRRLRDINLGIYHSQLKEKFYQAFPDIRERFFRKPKKGENLMECQKRMLSFIKEIEKKYQGKKILIISHGDPLWLFEEAMSGWSKEELLKESERKYIKVGELRTLEFKDLPYNQKMELDFHRPYIDEVKFYCPQCGGLMERVLGVIDCWFDSGAMPFGQAHWPFAWPQNFTPYRNEISGAGQKSKIKNPPRTETKFLVRGQKFLFPADYISEGIDQTRGWFYTLLAISTLLGFGPPYKNVLSVGHVLDEKGEKMSKSKGNVVDPWYIVEKYGADALRWYFYTINQPWDSKLFSEKDVLESLKKFILTFWNCWKFFETYKSKKSANLKTQSSKLQLQTKNLLDKWIVSKLNKLILETTQNLDKYDITAVARSIENFVINDLSLWYIRRSRKRFKEAAPTLNLVLLTLSKLTAPFIPFLSEEIFQKINYFPRWHLGNSVHLEDWPKVNKKLIDKNLEKKMEKVREIVSLALAERAKAKIKVRQPLNDLRLTTYDLRRDKEFLDLIKEEVNVKNISFGKEFKLDTEITPELKEEGIIREVIRNIQEMRKEVGFKPKDKILVRYFGTPVLNEILKRNKKIILTEGKIKDFQQKEGKQIFDFAFEKIIKVDQQNLWLAVKKI